MDNHGLFWVRHLARSWAHNLLRFLLPSMLKQSAVYKTIYKRHRAITVYIVLEHSIVVNYMLHNKQSVSVYL